MPHEITSTTESSRKRMRSQSQVIEVDEVEFSTSESEESSRSRQNDASGAASDSDTSGSEQNSLAESDDDSSFSLNSTQSPTAKILHSFMQNSSYLQQLSEAMRNANHKPIELYEKSVIKISCTSKCFSYESPWSAATQEECGGSGFVLSYNGIILIMSNAHVVSDSTNLSVRLADESIWYDAKVVLVDHDCDLSIISVPNAEFMNRIKPFELGELASMRKSLTVLGFPIGGEELFVADGTVSRIEVDSYAWSGLDLLQIQVTAAINSGNSGGPVLNTDGKVIGVAFQSTTGYEGLGYIIPSPIIKHFIDDYLRSVNTGQPYQGFPDLNFTFQGLQSPAYRKTLNLPDNEIGVRIFRIAPLCSSNNILHVEDILIELDGKPVKFDGTIQTEFSKRVKLDYLLSSKHINDTISAKVIRNGSVLDLTIPLKYRAGTTNLIDNLERDKPPTYYIFCATVFVPVTENLQNVAEISDDLDDDLDSMDTKCKKQPGQELVMVKEMFECEYTLHQSICCDDIIVKVNDEKIHNLRHLMQLIEKSTSEFIIFSTNRKLDFALKRISDAEHKAILSKFVIHRDRSDDLLLPPVYKPGCPEYEEQQRLALTNLPAPSLT